MSDRELTAAAWKTFATKQGVKDLILTKALADYEKVEEADHARLEEALAKIAKAVDGLKKESKGNKVVTAKLEDLAAAAKKAVIAAQDAQDAQGKEEPEDEDDAIDPAALKKKLIAALTAVKTRGPDDLPLQFMLALGPGQTAVLIGRKVGPTQKKQLAGMLADAGGLKYLDGTCVWEENLHTFVLETVPAGLAKKIQKALLAETEMRYKVRVRSLDGSVVFDSETDGEDSADEPVEDPRRAEFATALKKLKPDLDQVLSGQVQITPAVKALFTRMVNAAKAEQFAAALGDMPDLIQLVQTGLDQLRERNRPAAAAPAPKLTPEDEFKKRLAAVLPALKKVLTAGGAASTELKFLAGEANLLAKQDQHAKALELLARIEEGLAMPGAPTPSAPAPREPEPEPEPKPEPAPPPTGLCALWQPAAEAAAAQVQALAARLRQTGDEQMIAVAGTPLTDLHDRLEHGLTPNLEAYDEADSAGRQEMIEPLRETLGMMQQLLETELITLVDNNPFGVTVDIRGPITNALSSVTRALEAAA